MQLKLLVKGEGPRNTFLDTAFGNSVIEAVNALLALEVSPAGSGKLIPGKNKMILQLTPKPITETLNPFQCYPVGQLSDESGAATALKVAINQRSTIAFSSNWDDVAAIANFSDTFELTPALPLLWIRATANADGELVSATAERGATWDGYPKLYALDGDGIDDHTQTLWLPLAKLRAVEPGDVALVKIGATEYVLESYVTTHLAWKWDCAEDDTGHRIRALLPASGGLR